MEIKEIFLSKLKPYEKTSRRNDKAIKAVMKSIEKYGFKVPLVIDKENNLVTGNARYLAAKKLKLEKVPCIVAQDLTQEQIKAFRLVENKTAEIAKWDLEKLGEEIKTLATDLSAEFSFEVFDKEKESLEPSKAGLRPKNIFETLKVIFSIEQQKEVENALEEMAKSAEGNFGNTDSRGNALYEIVRQWKSQQEE